jgi:hypothetical protein
MRIPLSEMSFLGWTLDEDPVIWDSIDPELDGDVACNFGCCCCCWSDGTVGDERGAAVAVDEEPKPAISSPSAAFPTARPGSKSKRL